MLILQRDGCGARWNLAMSEAATARQKTKKRAVLGNRPALFCAVVDLLFAFQRIDIVLQLLHFAFQPFDVGLGFVACFLDYLLRVVTQLPHGFDNRLRFLAVLGVPLANKPIDHVVIAAINPHATASIAIAES